jgi:hypothetical protein
MNKKQQRQIAIRAARSQLRKNCADLTVANAAAVLDDMARSQPQLIASIWYNCADGRQWSLFDREWRKQSE